LAQWAWTAFLALSLRSCGVNLAARVGPALEVARAAKGDGVRVCWRAYSIHDRSALLAGAGLQLANNASPNQEGRFTLQALSETASLNAKDFAAKNP